MLKNFMRNSKPSFPIVGDLTPHTDAQSAFNHIEEIYQKSTQTIRSTFNEFISSDRLEERADKLTTANYPYVGIQVDNKDLNLDPRLSYGVVSEAGTYGGTVTRPDLFRSYYLEQIDLLLSRHKVPIWVGTSTSAIPLPFALDTTASFSDVTAIDLGQLWQMHSGFVLPNLTRIDDDPANCTTDPQAQIKPISIFSGERVDYSLHRLQHYTGTLPEHFQGFILLTNYQRYVDEFIQFSIQQLQNGQNEYTELITPGNISCKRLEDIPSNVKLPQMPAYHLKRADGMGITFINIGVGPSNAKTITDHVAVLRPHCWLMVGHCAGLRVSQTLGDYVLAHAYVREDHVLDQDLPLWIPLPPIAEVQVALQEAVANISHQKGQEVKLGMRTGTVVTTDNRNWELRSQENYERFRQSRAVAVDMESATVAANGFRFRVPYGTLLCVSDKPIHGEIKLQGMANKFYSERVNQHLKIGLEAVRILRTNGVDQLHSRKLRGFDEPPFR